MIQRSIHMWSCLIQDHMWMDTGIQEILLLIWATGIGSKAQSYDSLLAGLRQPITLRVGVAQASRNIVALPFLCPWSFWAELQPQSWLNPPTLHGKPLPLTIRTRAGPTWGPWDVAQWDPLSSALATDSEPGWKMSEICWWKQKQNRMDNFVSGLV